MRLIFQVYLKQKNNITYGLTVRLLICLVDKIGLQWPTLLTDVFKLWCGSQPILEDNKNKVSLLSNLFGLIQQCLLRKMSGFGQIIDFQQKYIDFIYFFLYQRLSFALEHWKAHQYYPFANNLWPTLLIMLSSIGQTDGSQ